MARAKVLVVGGAGYIGSSTARALLQAGHDVVTYDDLSTGYRDAVVTDLIVGDVRDTARLREVLSAGRFDAVLHFAARIAVGESVRLPVSYYGVNVGGSLSLVEAMAATGVRNIVFSSSAAVYGDPKLVPIPEDQPHAPMSPYGHSKAMVEQLLSDVRAEGFRVACMRYFNASGAQPDGSMGEAHHPETHLIPLAIAAAQGRRPPLDVFGDDYETRDGTCVRDYIHVVDLARAHVEAVHALLDGSPGAAWNVGTGTGITVREVLDAVGAEVGSPVPHRVVERRPGDPACLVADPSRIQRELGWRAELSDLNTIVQTATRWAAAPRYGAAAQTQGLAAR